MQEQKITIETAKLAKGLDLTECQCVIIDDLGKVSGEMPYFLAKRSKKLWYRIPTQSLLQKWLREVHNIVVMIDFEISETKVKGKSYTYKIDSFRCIICRFNEEYTQGDEIHTDAYKTWEEALEAGLQAGLNLIKTE